MSTPKTALILVDIQKGLDDWDYYGGNRNNPDAEIKAAEILNLFRNKSWPIFHVRHSSQNAASPLHASKPGFAIKEEVKPLVEEPVLTKDVNAAFIGTDLQNRLDAQAITQVVIVGLTTNHCVSSTARMAANLGYKTILISDAIATFDRIGINGEKYSAETIHLTTLASLNEEFATILKAASFIKDYS